VRRTLALELKSLSAVRSSRKYCARVLDGRRQVSDLAKALLRANKEFRDGAAWVPTGEKPHGSAIRLNRRPAQSLF